MKSLILNFRVGTLDLTDIQRSVVKRRVVGYSWQYPAAFVAIRDTDKSPVAANSADLEIVAN